MCLRDFFRHPEVLAALKNLSVPIAVKRHVVFIEIIYSEKKTKKFLSKPSGNEV